MDRVEQWRQGFFAQTRWEDLAIDDMDVRLKWAGLFHRKRRTPGRFMLRLKVGDCRALFAPTLRQSWDRSILHVFRVRQPV